MNTHRRCSVSSYETDENDELNDNSDLIEEKIMNEEYKIWKKNSPYLYDMIIADTLESTLSTCQWFKDFYKGEDHRAQRILMGAHVTDNRQNYVQIGSVELPLNNTITMNKKIEEGVSIVQTIKHDGIINKARYNPKNQDIIATKSEYGNVYIFDRTKHPDKPVNVNSSCRPDLTLKGHTEDGHGLSWNSFKNGHIIDSSKDMTICYWDISGNGNGKALEPLHIFKGSKSCVQDVEWHTFNPNMFGSVDNNRTFSIWDIRYDKSVRSVQAHEKGLTTLAFNPKNEFVFVTGSIDKNLNLWDLRNLRIKLHTLENHESNIVDVEWSPHDENILASASADRRINIWDLSRIGTEQTVEEEEEGPPELLFMHGGHMNKISELSWNPHAPCMIASIANNIVHIWQPSSDIYSLDEDSSDEF